MAWYEWHEMTPEREKKYLRAGKFTGRWKFETTLKTDPDWTEHEILPVEDLEVLRGLMWKRYQRKKLAFSMIEEIDAMIEEGRKALPDEEE